MMPSSISRALLFGAALVTILSSTAANAADLLDKIKADKVFTVATEARFAPFEFVEDGKIVGYSADIMVEVMKALPGVELKRLDLP